MSKEEDDGVAAATTFSSALLTQTKDGEGARPASDPREISPTRSYDVAKRVVDLVLATIIVLVTLPVWILVAAGIKLTSSGPILYRATVVGKNRKKFTYYKFRSMTDDNSDEDHRQFIYNYVKYNSPQITVDDNGLENHSYKAVNHSRVTRIGQFIRQSSIDELPQLVNVIRGEMSLVGPRPPVDHEYELYNDWASRRLAVLPGITGLYQVEARNHASFTDMVEIDLEYIRRRSIWLDLWIVIRTPRAMLRGQ